MVFLLVGLNQLLFLWISGMRGHAPGSWMYWLPSVSSMLLWPWVWITLQDLRQRLQVT
jgi:rod shape-determining protein MreD